MITITNRIVVATASALLLLAGLLVITGWYFHVPLLTTIYTDAVPVRMNAAICITLSGVVLYLNSKGSMTNRTYAVTVCCSLLVLLIGLVTFAEYITGSDLGIDNLLYTYTPATDNVLFTDRMSMPASVQALLLGLSMLLLPKREFHAFIHAACLLIILSALLTMLNYLCGSDYFGKRFQFHSTSPLASTAFILCCTGIYFSPQMSYLKVSFQLKIAGFFGFVLLVLGFFFLALKNNNSAESRNAYEIENTSQVISAVEMLHTRLEAMQNSIKNFLVLSDKNFLEEYYNSVHAINEKLREIHRLTAGHGFIELKTDSVALLLSRYINSQDLILARHSREETDADSLKKIIEDGKKQTDLIRTRLLAIKKEENGLMQKLRLGETAYLRTSNRIISLSQYFALFFLLVAFYMIYRNSRSRDRADAALDKSEKFLKAIISNTNNPVAIRDLKGRYMMINGPMENITGIPSADIQGKTLWEVHPPELADAAKQGDDAVITSKKVFVREHTVLAKGEIKTYVVSRFPIKNENNDLYAIGSIGTDVTALKNAKEQLEEFMHFFNNSNDLCVICNMSSAFESINPTTFDTLGYTAMEMLGKSFIDFVHPDDILFIIRELEKSKVLKQGPINFSRRFLKKSGEYIWLNWKASADFVAGKIYAIGRDITEQKNLEEKLKQFNFELENLVEEKTNQIAEKESQYKFLLANMREGIQVINYDWRYIYVNNSVVGQSRYKSEDELLGYTILEKYPGVEHTPLFATLKQCMEERTEHTLETPFEFPDGSSGWFELSVQPVPEGIFILSIDITSRKKAEEKIKNYTDELKKSNAELERFAYIASHDLQEPLRMVSSFMNLLGRRLEGKLDDTAKQYMHYATDGAERMKALIHDLLEYSRIGRQNEAFTPVDPAECMSYVTRVLGEEISRTGAIITVKPMPVIMASKILFSQLLVNLISNAIKYNGNRTPEIEVGCSEEKKDCVFYVRDNGEGIDPKFFNKIFIIFQRLHNKGAHSGTGIGLAICKKIIEIHKGKIWVESEPGKGSTFYFTLSTNAL